MAKGDIEALLSNPDTTAPDYSTGERIRITEKRGLPGGGCVYSPRGSATLMATSLSNPHQPERIESLHAAISSLTAKQNRDELLTAIMEEAMKLVGARDCGIYAYYPERRELVVIRDFRRPEFKGEKKLRVGQGGAGNLIQSGKPYLIIPNYSQSEYKAEVYEEKDFGTVLEVRLISQQETIGVLYVDDVVTREFTDDDGLLLCQFADSAAVALTHMEHEDRLERLIDSSPLGIIEVKRGGDDIKGSDAIITRFNKAAEGIFGYEEKEVLGKPVSLFYADPKEPKKIGNKLWRNKGKLSNYFTKVKAKDGRSVPIRQATTWVFDSAGRRTGSVGFFEDLTLIREKERQFEILLNASNLIATADNITAGLNALAELVINSVGGTFCRILLLDEATDSLVPKAAYRREGSQWNPALEQVANLSEWPLLRAVLHEKKPAVRHCDDPEIRPYLEKLAKRLSLDNPIQCLLVVPLSVDQNLIGLLHVGEERESSRTIFDQTAIDLAAAIGAQTAVLIGRERARLRFESLFKASTALLSLDDPNRVLKNVVKRAREAAGASSVSFIQIDEHGRAINLTAAGIDSVPAIDSVIRPDGISMRVWRSGEPVAIENTSSAGNNFNPELRASGEIQAAVCLPISIQGSSLGVMWVHYREPRRFRQYEIANLQLCVNQAALAYDSSRRIDELKRIRGTANTLAKATTQEEVLKEIVASACKALSADSAIIWLYDGRNFLRELSQSHGIPEHIWKEFQERGPLPYGTAARVIKKGVLEVADVREPNEIGETTRELLGRVAARRFLGITLKVNDVLGVLYVNFKQARGFRPEEREMILSFASQAALALKKSRLLEQLEKTQRTANAVAEVTALGKLPKTLDSITKGTQECLDCDAVTLFVYDPDRGVLLSPPSMVGVWYPEKASKLSVVPPGTIVFFVLNSLEIITVPDVKTDPLYRNSRFARDEKIESFAGIPLRVDKEPVGVMFVSYRTPHVFSDFEKDNIKLFSNQAAIAIHNAKLFDRTKKDLTDREKFLKLSNELLATLSLEDATLSLEKTMDCVVRFCADALETEFSGLVLTDNNGRLIYRAGVGWPKDMIGTSLGRGDKSQSGYTIREGHAIWVDDFDEERRFKVPNQVSEHKLKSALSFPMTVGQDITGVVIVHTAKKRRFGSADIEQLRLIANQAAIAIRSAQRHKETERARSQVETLYEATKTSTAVSSETEHGNILDSILKRAVEQLRPKAVLGTLHKYDADSDEMTLVTAYPKDRFDDLIAKIGDKRPRAGNEKTEFKSGIIGRAILKRETQIASNADPEYVMLDPTTRSEMAVPLKDDDKVIGALNIESNKVDAFDKSSMMTIESLAEHALMVMRLAKTYKTVAARTALAFMGMSGNIWYHSVRNKANAIRKNVDLLNADYEDRSPLTEIYEAAGEIIDLPRLQALSSKENRRLLQINSHLKERISQLEDNGHLAKGMCKPDLASSNDLTVKVDPNWLNEVFDVLINNAKFAMRACEEPCLIISTSREGRNAVVKFRDNGSGIPEEIKDKILIDPITEDRDANDKGWGLGLLMARFIVQVYGGEIAIGETSPAGTTMIIRLPVEEAHRE